ncbi:MAG: hypothetical protein IKB01_07495 [Lachnospiraceae bacterium]|nr:hypothetical protein [Lachnospiraceae bacterium]
MYLEKIFSHIKADEMMLVNKGYGKLTVHSLAFDRHYSKEQKLNNRKLAETLSKEEWAKHCDKAEEALKKPMQSILQKFICRYDIHQVSKETSTIAHYKSDWDLFFWSDKGVNKKDFMTFFTLTFNKRRSPEDNMQLLEEIIPFIEAMDYENTKCRIQYDVVLDEEKIAQQAKNYFEKSCGKYVDYFGMVGKIKVISEENGIQQYGFFKKNAKKTYYHISNLEMVAMSA